MIAFITGFMIGGIIGIGTMCFIEVTHYEDENNTEE